MSYYRDTDYDPDAPVSDADAADALRHRAATDYMAAREAVKRIHHRMTRDEVWAIKCRYAEAERYLKSLQESDAYREANDRCVREIRGAA